MSNHKTPGVYVEEISTLPPSVAEVSTAIPAFFGYTEKGPSIARVTTFLEYEQLFGGAAKETFTVTVDTSGKASVQRTTEKAGFLLHYAISLYFNNGGGACYVVSVGKHIDAPKSADFEAGLELLAKEDEPTLIVLTDAVNLNTVVEYYKLCEKALAQCHTLGDRFSIFDVPGGDVAGFRDEIGTSYLAYGAAYHPYLETSLSYVYKDADVTVTVGAEPAVQLDTLKAKPVYQQVSAALAATRIILPPSAAIAGVYASVDRDRGVWKAPANVSIASVIGPVIKITNKVQDGLNVDVTAGKSINAIRAFTGKGTLVWGARTLAGNDNEWRYVPVRRLFIMIEESAQKATSFAVFEPNDATTWLKVKGMIESFLYGLWERGALAGPTPAAAYFVHVGLGKTMTTQDILEGRLNVAIGIAAVRPAEFIILKFSHKLQEA